MKIALINGSPKIKGSSSGSLLKNLQNYLTEKSINEEKSEKNTAIEIIEIPLHSADISQDTVMQLKSADTWVFSCPLYVDGIPAHLLSCLVRLEKLQAEAGSQSAHPETNNIHVHAIVNCGFYEGIQAEYALQIFRNWCVKTGYTWCGGIGVGGGGGLSQMPASPSGHGPKAPILSALSELAAKILTEKKGENKYVSVAFPRFLYKMGAQLGWRQMIREGGGRTRDLSARPTAK